MAEEDGGEEEGEGGGPAAAAVGGVPEGEGKEGEEDERLCFRQAAAYANVVEEVGAVDVGECTQPAADVVEEGAAKPVGADGGQPVV